MKVPVSARILDQSSEHAPGVLEIESSFYSSQAATLKNNRPIKSSLLQPAGPSAASTCRHQRKASIVSAGEPKSITTTQTARGKNQHHVLMESVNSAR